MTANEIIQEIEKRRLRRLQERAKVFRQTVCRASDIGDCDREIYYQIVNWEQKPVPEPERQARFEEGIEQHHRVHRDLMEDGFEIIEAERPFELKGRNGKVIISGHIDGKIHLQGARLAYEVKSLNPNLFAQINCIEDFNKYEWARKFPRQMQCYIFGQNDEEGIYILNDCLGHRKFFSVQLDLEQTEKILQRCELVMDCVEKLTPPPFHKDYSVCRRCWAFGRVCAPDIEIKGAEIIEDPEIEEALKRWEELKASVREANVLDKRIKEYFENRPDVIVGDFHITGQKVKRHLKATEERDIEFWQMKTERIKGGDKDEREKED